jgi:capsule polysaccharide export protein KpsE/RkpR
MSDVFSQIRKHFALEAKRIQFRARSSNNFIFSIYYSSGWASRITRAILIMSAISIISTSIYFFFLFSARYKSEFQFSIQNAVFLAPPAGGANESALGLALVQNTQIAYEYLISFDLYQKLESNKVLESHYSSSKIDFFSRYKPHWSDEQKYGYWKNLLERKLVLPGGTLKVTLTGFDVNTPNDINKVLAKLIADRLNSVNSNIYDVLIRTNTIQLDKAQLLYEDAIAALKTERIISGQIEPAKWSDNVMRLMSDLYSTLLLAKSELATLNSQSLGRSPQARVAQTRLDELSVELERLKQSIYTDDQNDNKSLVHALQTKSSLELQKNIAERLIFIATENTKISEILSDITKTYVQVFVKPNIVVITTIADRSVLALFTIGIILAIAFCFLKAIHMLQLGAK